MSGAWAGDDQLPLFPVACACVGGLGCLHDVPPAGGRLHPGRTDLDQRLLELGGLDLSIVRARAQRQLDLPPVIPAIDGSPASLGIVRDSVAVMYADWKQRPKAMSSRDRIGIPEGPEVLLVLFAHDDVLERLWTSRYAFLERLRGSVPTVVVAPSFSTWSGDTWLEHRYQMMRSFELYRLLQARGHIAIPHVAWGRRVDGEDVVRWLNGNRVAEIAMDAQCLGPLLEPWLVELAWLRERLDSVPHLIVGGIGPGPRLRALRAVWPETSFLYNGLRTAACHREVRVDAFGRKRRVTHTVTRSDRPALWALPTRDPSAAELYERSLRTFERELVVSTDAGHSAQDRAPLVPSTQPARARATKSRRQTQPEPVGAA